MAASQPVGFQKSKNGPLEKEKITLFTDGVSLVRCHHCYKHDQKAGLVKLSPAK